MHKAKMLQRKLMEVMTISSFKNRNNSKSFGPLRKLLLWYSHPSSNSNQVMNLVLYNIPCKEKCNKSKMYLRNKSPNINSKWKAYCKPLWMRSSLSLIPIWKFWIWKSKLLTKADFKLIKCGTSHHVLCILDMMLLERILMETLFEDLPEKKMHWPS